MRKTKHQEELLKNVERVVTLNRTNPGPHIVVNNDNFSFPVVRHEFGCRKILRLHYDEQFFFFFFFFFFFGIQVYCPGYSHETDADVSTSAGRYYKNITARQLCMGACMWLL